MAKKNKDEFDEMFEKKAPVYTPLSEKEKFQMYIEYSGMKKHWYAGKNQVQENIHLVTRRDIFLNKKRLYSWNEMYGWAYYKGDLSDQEFAHQLAEAEFHWEEYEKYEYMKKKMEEDEKNSLNNMLAIDSRIPDNSDNSKSGDNSVASL